MPTKELTHVIVGGGAAGFFGAIACAQFYPSHRVILIEKTRQPLAKVRISGGGRCNVTHGCFDPALLVKNYPRGGPELRGPFSRFQPKDTIQWFESRGVQLKTEEDGRMFPTTDSSETIIACLQAEARRLGVQIRLECGVQQIDRLEEGFRLTLSNEEELTCDRILIATGSSSKMYPLLEKLGHTIVPLVPSLFTFNLPQSPLTDLAGVSVPLAQVKLTKLGFEQTGPLLITHWGLSGPAVLKLSAWAARELHALDYQTDVVINWLPQLTEEALRQALSQHKQANPAKQIGSEAPVNLPKQLWKRLVQLAGIEQELRWSTLSNKHTQALINQLRASTFHIQGKTTYKQEFVTCGGVALEEVNFKTMESRRCPHLFFAGEVLNIDGITGGFNFQNAWTTSWIAGQSMGISA
ncbi:NAD(P)/FAD-dependent oxidoreductase [Candidatus Protochlamydia phocaeensis]|uniref:NAD(P)/FAD-dependent oxidoreductase n=1 Tax=Candidatus Protochlamydia phocaeensis TaxID=1414722 RepID=UPI0008389AE6|nr:NAD(P)/FAD-dependent oxidoreductase [Candidatus Protochlamydia phocaeensis]